MSEDFLKRYTNLPVLIYLLKNQKLTLLDPKTWDDSNDSYCLSVYKEQKSLKTVLALCFTETPETYHHWHIFADGSSGVCVTFKREKLLEILSSTPGITYDSVRYIALKKLRKKISPLEELPFIKRLGFQDEAEFRVIYESQKKSLETKDICVSLQCIEKITLSPWMPKALAKPMKDTIHSINGCTKLKIVRSSLVGNAEWKKLLSSAK